MHDYTWLDVYIGFSMFFLFVFVLALCCVADMMDRPPPRHVIRYSIVPRTIVPADSV